MDGPTEDVHGGHRRGGDAGNFAGRVAGFEAVEGVGRRWERFVDEVDHLLRSQAAALGDRRRGGEE